MENIYLTYVGNASLPGVPARDLTEDEAKEHGVETLLATGLYVRAKSTSKPKAAQNKAASGGEENKGA